jgi:DNA-binding GntR family transcriptional regulator
MSIRWISGVWENGPDDAVKRLVLLKLADNADDNGYCFPSLEDICAKTKLSISTVRRSVKALELDGWVTVTRGRGAGHHSRYQLHQRVLSGKLSDGKVSQRKISDKPKNGFTQTEKDIRQENPPDPLM